VRQIKIVAVVCLALSGLLAGQNSPPSPARPIDDADTVTLPGNVHPLAKSQFDAGLTDPTEKMERIILVLAPRSGAEAELDYLGRA
jgi:pseudomonalisin